MNVTGKDNDHNIIRDAMRRWLNRLLLLALLATHGVAYSSTHGARRGEGGARSSSHSSLDDAYIPPLGVTHFGDDDDGGGGGGAMIATTAASSSRLSPTASGEYRGMRGRGLDDRVSTMTTTKIKTTDQEEQTGRRRDQDVEDLLNDMATRDPSDWSGIEWFVMLLFLSFLGWSGCCLLALCCCGGCSFSDLLRYLCLWELCCRGGRDVAECCEYGLA